MITNLIKLHRYWGEKKEQKAFPARKDLDPIDFHYALGDVSLIDIVQDDGDHNPRYKVRLLGSNIQDRIRGAFRSRYLEDFPEQESLNKMKIAYREVLKTGEPLAYPSFFKFGEKEQPFVCCIWPLSSDGTKVDMLLCCREQLFKFDKTLKPEQPNIVDDVEIWPYQNWKNTPLFAQFIQ